MKPLIGIVLLAVVAIAACSTPAHIPAQAEGGSAEYELGSPNFDMDAVATIRNGASGVDIHISIPHSSLAFTKRDGGFAARYELLARIRRAGSSDPISSESWIDTLRVADFAATMSGERVHQTRRVPLAEGTYAVEVSLENVGGEARAIRRRDVEVFDAHSPAISDVQLIVARGGDLFEPALSVHVPAGYDSMRTLTELYNIGNRAEARLTLVRLVSDTTIAGPPFWFTPGPGSLPYMGIDYERGDTLQVSRRSIRDAADEVAIEFNLPVLDPGNYMALFEVDVEGADERQMSRKYFSVKRPDFPRITSIREMAEALAYIARSDELRHILSAESSPEMRARFDAFWAERVPNRDVAATVLQSYYSRVEEANILFSNHKEGWKTDKGMIYIVLGPPIYTESHHIRDAWFYFERGFPLSQRLPPFVFRRSMAYGFAGLFDNYVLQRAEVYENIWRRRVEKWREGVPL